MLDPDTKRRIGYNQAQLQETDPEKEDVQESEIITGIPLYNEINSLTLRRAASLTNICRLSSSAQIVYNRTDHRVVD